MAEQGTYPSISLMNPRDRSQPENWRQTSNTAAA